MSQDIKAAMAALSQQLEALGLPALAVVSPDECVAQALNARYMDQQTMENLTKNVQKDGRLESAPLVCRDEASGGYAIISGHHRVEAAKRAGLKHILVMLAEPKNESELRAKQLAHNALVGRDDAVLLQKLYDGIKDLEAKYYSGLQDQLERVAFSSLNFKAGTYESFTVAFIPEDIEAYDQAAALVEGMDMAGAEIVRLAPLKSYAAFSDAIRKVKKVENIKSNGAALSRLVELAQQRLAQVAAENAEREAAEEAANPKKSKKGKGE